MSKKKVVYSASFKDSAVAQVFEGKEGITQVAKKLKVSFPTLSKWVKMKKEQEQLADGTPIKKEIEKLKRQIEKEKIKHAILKDTLKTFSSKGKIDI